MRCGQRELAAEHLETPIFEKKIVQYFETNDIYFQHFSDICQSRQAFLAPIPDDIYGRK